MRWNEIGLVWRKELLDTLRDRRTIMAMIVAPLLVYPVIIILLSQIGIAQVEKIRSSSARVAVIPPDAAPDLMAAFEADTSFTVVASQSPETDLGARELDVVIRFPHDFTERVASMDSVEVTMRVDLSRERGEQMRERVRDFLLDWRRDLVAERLEAESLPPTFVSPFAVRVDNAAGERKMGGSFVGRILPFFLVVMMMTGAFYPAIDVTAGERERGTLETLLVAPASRFSMVIGKFLTVFVASIVTTLANLVSIAFTVFFLIGSANLGGGVAESLTSLVDFRALLLIFVIMIPLAIMMSSLSMLVASFARSFKEAQNYLSPMMIAVMAPGYLSFLPGVEIDTQWTLIPIANVVLLTRELLLGNYVWTYFGITLITTTALALLLLHLTVRLFGGEAMLGGGESPRLSLKNLLRPSPHPGRTESLSPGTVAPVFLLVLLGFFYLGTPLQLWDLKVGLVLTQILVIAGIPVLALRMLRIPWRPSLGFTAPRHPLVYFLALVGAPAATLVAALVGMAQGLVMEVPESYRELMERLFQAEGQTDLVFALLIFAVVPGICEEILFRGFILRGLSRRMPPLTAIFWTALLFGAFHFDLYRLLPTAMLGFVLGLLVWVTGSLWPSILLHAANNSIAVLANNLDSLKNIPWLQEGAAIPIPVAATILALGVIAGVGLWRLRPDRDPLAGDEEFMLEEDFSGESASPAVREV